MIPKIINILDTKHNIKIENYEVVQDTRGITVLKVQVNSDFFALKFYSKSDDSEQTYRNLTLINEANILKEIQDEFNYYYKSGDDNNYTWLLTHWLDGIKSNLYLNKIIDKRILINSIKKILKRFYALHSKGILHGDVQPKHIQFNKLNEVDLIDFGLSRHIKNDNTIYKGGLVHFNSPEIAKKMIEDADNIAYDMMSEIYSIGSVLFFNLTGKTSTNYGTEDYKSISFKDKLKIIVSNNRNTFLSTNYMDYPELERILNIMLEPDSKLRCSNLKILIDKLDNIN
jgi:serine/threonine protein kinase